MEEGGLGELAFLAAFACDEASCGLELVEGVMALLGGVDGGIDVPGARVELRGRKMVFIQQKAAIR